VAYSHALAGGDVDERSLCKDESIRRFLDIDDGFHCCRIASGLVCVRYVNRMSDDRPVIMLYVAALVLFAVGAVFFYFKWIKERGKEEGACTEKR
jgi:hypothetical protein